MKNSFFSNSFKVRAKVSSGIILIVVLGTLTPNSDGLRIVYGAAAAISLMEVHALTTEQKQLPWSNLFHSVLSSLVLALSIVVAMIMPRNLLIIGIALTMISDVGAYVVGKLCGGKLIRSRPFPTISPNKSWEGIVGGLLVPGLAVMPLNYLFRDSLPGRPMPILLGCLAGFCAIVGDTSESLLKRRYGVKDANDLIKDKFGFCRLEALLGGSEGHGGYYDRLDSMSVVLLLLGIVTVVCTYSP